METSNTPVVIFSYKIKDILTEVTKRTSYLGKMRNTEAVPNLIDRISLTDGERFLSDEFLEDAVQQTYDWLKAFGRNVKNACQIVSEYQDYLEYKDYGIEGVSIAGGEPEPIGTPFPLSCVAIPDYTNNTISVQVPIQPQYKNTITTDVDYTTTCEYTIKTKLANVLPCEETRTVVQTGTCNISSPINLDFSTILNFQWQEGRFQHVLDSVDVSVCIVVKPHTIIDYKKGDYIEYRNDLSDPSVYEVYQITDNCTNANWSEHAAHLVIDPRGRIVYTLEKTDYFDDNMIGSIDRNIKEAIINYIMYRWLTYTKPDEGDIYLTRFEDYIQRAKLGLESETSVQQRRYKLY